MRAVLSAGRDALAAGDSVEEVLWAVWSATELDNRLQASALRGGATGSQADRDLDAMMALLTPQVTTSSAALIPRCAPS